MVKLVLLHKADSKYDDEPDVVYDFPRSYLTAVTSAVGYWVVYYEPVKAGSRGYFSVAKISEVINKTGFEDLYLALIEPNSFILFVKEVPRLLNGRPLEASLTGLDGKPKRGGIVQRAVRTLSENEFATMVHFGLPQNIQQLEVSKSEAQNLGLMEDVKTFDRPVIERLTHRPYRDAAFRRKVLEAYDYRCAISGLCLRNGNGRPEVQAAHIRPVEHKGSDAVRNGLALSATVHWMFDRGLISVAEDLETILVSRNKVPSDVAARLISPTGKLIPPERARDEPHPANLTWHRENVVGGATSDDFGVR
ncbi:MAG: HNH endonuclease [Pseudomonadota bacterium]